MFVHLAFLVAAASAPAAAPPNCADATAFVGTICAPASAGKHPAILLLGGSEGGNTMAAVAPRFAQRGYVAASVAYFRMPGLPQTLENVPVESVGKAVAAIAARADVDPNRIAILGGSKGGELALLAASTYPQIHAVIADVPSPFAWQGIPNGPAPATSSWTIDGKPVPYVQYTNAMGQAFAEAFTRGNPLKLRTAYDDAMQQNKNEIPAAMFHLENIHGPVLMLAAGDDGIWDSVAQVQIGMQYLHDHHHPYADQSLQYPAAGHMFLFASAQHPLTQASMGPVALLFGGTPQANAGAGSDAWAKIYAFLQTSLQAAVGASSK
jgi:dienelactone hydrolase